MRKWLDNPPVLMGTVMAVSLVATWILGWMMGFQGEPKSFGL